MITLKFKCHLLSDIILNQKSASEGENTTLDFIPGNNFLGIVASQIYPDTNISMDVKWELFHSGKVRFGDAHPSTGDIRGEKIPASVFYPKMESVEKEAYIHHMVPDLASKEMREKQLKQCRNGFYAFNESTATRIATENTYAIKSAHDKENRKSQDTQMFGYQSLRAGIDMMFCVEVENEVVATMVKAALEGKHKVGRSRSAQYGLVEISATDYKVPSSLKPNNDTITVYADGRLIFLDENGLPTMQPTVEQLGLSNGTIIWEESQIRTFCYAPYNYQRRCFDTDRCGIEKGSVFVVKTSEVKEGMAYIGSYNNEGFGSVVYNPSFLNADSEGHATVKFTATNQTEEKKTITAPKTELVKFLIAQKTIEDIEHEIYPMTNKWVRNNHKRFKDSTFASQWGAIRSIAMTTKMHAELKASIMEYIGHGVASEKWSERGRKKALTEEFIDKLNDDNAQIAIVNLSAEMAKICRKEDKK